MRKDIRFETRQLTTEAVVFVAANAIDPRVRRGLIHALTGPTVPVTRRDQRHLALRTVVRV